MSTFTPDAPVYVRPYAVRVNGADAVIGDTARGVYLTIPVEGLDLLEPLAAGLTVGEAVRRFEDKHDFSPDVDDFLEALAGDGFVAPSDTPVAEDSGPRHDHIWNLEWLSPRTAQRMLSWPVWVFGLAVFALAMVGAVTDPAILPSLNSLKFSNPALLWALYLCGLVGIYLHELGHVVGARAAGVSATLKVGNQMSNMVAESDISAMWLASKRQRYAALLIGPFIDLVMGSLLLILLWSGSRGLIALPEGVQVVATAVVMSYVIRLNWQIYVYVRTDIYYVLAVALGAPSLMADTRAYLRNIYRRLRKRPLVDQAGLSRKERIAIRCFIPIWFLGRVFQIGILTLVVIPTLWYYLEHIGMYVLGQTTQDGAFTLFDVLSVVVLVIAIEGGGIVLWIRELIRARRSRKLAPNRVYVE